MLLSRDESIINAPALRLAARPAQAGSVNVPLWTDDFASLFQILRSGAHPRPDPEFSAAQQRITAGLCQRGDFAGAIAAYHQALQSHPDLPDLLNNLAWLLATCPEASRRNGPEAVQRAERACELTHYNLTPLVGTLAAAYAEAGRFEEAILMAEKACAQAEAAGDRNLLKRNQELLELYRRHQAHHETIEKLVPAAP
jgi:tetratricopeptide (TPR) repeat protein